MGGSGRVLNTALVAQHPAKHIPAISGYFPLKRAGQLVSTVNRVAC